MICSATYLISHILYLFYKSYIGEELIMKMSIFLLLGQMIPPSTGFSPKVWEETGQSIHDGSNKQDERGKYFLVRWGIQGV